MDSPEIPSPVDASLKYLVPTELLKTEKPYMSSVPFTKDEKRTSNFLEKEYQVPIYDVRGHEVEFKLNTNGFEYMKHDFEHQPMEKIEQPDHPYLTEVSSVLKAFLQAKDVVIYDCNVRKIGNPKFFQAARSAHVDHSSGNVRWRLQEALSRSRPNGIIYDRWLAVILWRPLSNPVTDWPLAVCDFTSIEDEDLHAVDTVLPHRVNEIYHLEHNPGHKWYYMSDQCPNESLVMKIFDSDAAQAQYSAHAAFDSTKMRQQLGPPRQSADVRAFVFF
ncbi:hypothetical protein BKA56DRAFT_668414 [Ilyonectria sp. MPI-CAGE-AT-0026]|nr:hypothetical protein BKA56DRAFT_668414 [Ilyonectria sp. MPI-CAGE-AT-0026]